MSLFHSGGEVDDDDPSPPGIKIPGWAQDRSKTPSGFGLCFEAKAEPGGLLIACQSPAQEFRGLCQKDHLTFYNRIQRCRNIRATFHRPYITFSGPKALPSCVAAVFRPPSASTGDSRGRKILATGRSPCRACRTNGKKREGSNKNEETNRLGRPCIPRYLPDCQHGVGVFLFSVPTSFAEEID